MDASLLTAEPPHPVDRRGSARTSASYRARIRLAPQAVAECRTADISRGGLALWSAEPIAPGRTVQLALQLPDTHRGGSSRFAMASATVVFQIAAGRRFLVGLQWLTLQTAALDRLAVWLERRAA